ncbi:MAG: Uma2 family endonuclease [Acidimicrobiales bacterium]
MKDYHRMAEAEVFAPDDRVELFDGRVYDMAPIGSRHAACVKRLASLLGPQLGTRAMLSVQDPVYLDDRSEPQPDLALLKPKADFYAAEHPRPSDVLLAVEVAETTLEYDLHAKAPRYLEAGIPEVWVIDVVREVVHVATTKATRTFTRTESVAPRAFPDLVFHVAAILP